MTYRIGLFGQQTTISGRITKWLLLFLEYDFTVVYKLNKIHVVANALSILTNIIEPISVPNQTTNASLFYTKPECLKDVKEFLRTRQIEGTLLV
jgi:hypothetical protein